MDTDGPGECVLETLSDGECLRLMASVPVGRIVYTRARDACRRARQLAFDSGHIVIRTHPGGKLAAAIGHAVVAFEADELDFVTHTGWSVTIVGTAQEVSDPAEMRPARGASAWTLGGGGADAFRPHQAGGHHRPAAARRRLGDRAASPGPSADRHTAGTAAHRRALTGRWPSRLLLIVSALVIRRILDRSRMAAWDAEWSATGPQWCK